MHSNLKNEEDLYSPLIPAHLTVTCNKCYGMGKRFLEEDRDQYEGHKLSTKKRCPDCNGDGFTRKDVNKMSIKVTAEVSSRKCIAYIDHEGDLFMDGFCIETSGAIYGAEFNPANAKTKLYAGDKVTLEFWESKWQNGH